MQDARREDKAGKAPAECARRSFRSGWRSRTPARISRAIPCAQRRSARQHTFGRARAVCLRSSSRAGTRDRARERAHYPAPRKRSRHRSADAGSVQNSARHSAALARAAAETHNKDYQAGARQRPVHGFHFGVVEPFAEAFRAHDDSAQVRRLLDLLDGLENRRRLDSRHERKGSEREKPSLSKRTKRCVVCLIVIGCVCRSAVRFQLVVEFPRRLDSLGGSKKVEPRISE